jgi:hypothetical protein
VKLVIASAKSTNSKIGDAATTYAAQQSCPTSCVFRDGGGCYAEAGSIGKFITDRLNASADGVTALEVAYAEAAAIDRMTVTPGKPMRLHTVGDCATDEAARIVAAACDRYVQRGGGTVWTYTHAWRDVARESWGNVSVLASCETVADVFWARQRGYATSIVVDKFPTEKKYELVDDMSYPCGPGPDGHVGGLAPHPGQDVVPCPSQTRGIHCTDCRLCFDDGKLRRGGVSIGFEVHGTPLTQKKALRALDAPDDPERRLTSRDHAVRFRDMNGRWPRPVELATVAGVNTSSASEMLRRMRDEVAA